ncbi:MAG: hypothetical protein IIU35_02880 [Neisseriaceae bacterium]|nr:hypothetical protein [Neisseriaceae bacterium]MBQ5429326.1 hypothetical protein [Neisseriaceae bacterium]
MQCRYNALRRCSMTSSLNRLPRFFLRKNLAMTLEFFVFKSHLNTDKVFNPLSHKAVIYLQNLNVKN